MLNMIARESDLKGEFGVLDPLRREDDTHNEDPTASLFVEVLREKGKVKGRDIIVHCFFEEYPSFAAKAIGDSITKVGIASRS